MPPPRVLAPLIALLLFSFGAVVEARPADTVRVMSYNIRIDRASDEPTWAQRRGPMANQVLFVDPDILGVQEARPAMVRWLGNRLEGWERYGVGRDDGARRGETVTLFWRAARFEAIERQTVWCSPTPETPSRGWDAAHPRTITRVVLRDRANDRLWDVRNTHFDHRGEKARANCADQLAAMAPAEGANLVVLGDFNAGPSSEPYRRLVGSGLTDARSISPIVFGPDGTFNAFNIAQTDGEAVDHVFVGPGLHVRRFGVLTDSFGGKVISDHFPVVADIAPAAEP